MMAKRPVIGFVFRYDSHFLALKTIYEKVVACDVDVFFCGLESQSWEFITKTIGRDVTVFYPDNIGSFLGSITVDYIFCAAGGRDLNDLTNATISKNTTVISCFPGILLSSQLESFVSKIRSNYVLLNCRKDYKIYKTVCRIVGVPFNGILYGAPWVKTLPEQKTGNNHCLIVDQLQEPFTEKGRMAYASFLASIIKTHPGRTFTFKSRDHLISPGSMVFDIPCYLKRFEFDNLLFSEESIDDLLAEVDECITISSSAAINCLMNKVNVYLIDGFTASFRGQDYFQRSGLVVHHQNFSFETRPCINERWFNNSVAFSQHDQNVFLKNLLVNKTAATESVANVKRSPALITALVTIRYLFLFLKRENWIVLKRIKTVLSRLV